MYTSTLLLINYQQFYENEFIHTITTVITHFPGVKLKTRMWKYFTAHNDTRRYIDILPLNAYNNTIHSSTKMKPSEVRQKHEMEIRKRLYPKQKVAKKSKRKGKK